MKKLVIFQPFGDRRGGSDVVLMTMLAHRDPELFDPVVVLLGEGDFAAEIESLGVRTLTLPPGRMRDPLHLRASVSRCRSVLAAERPDLVLNWLSTAHVYAGPAARLEGLSDRCVWWQQDLFSQHFSGEARLGDRLAALRGRALDQVATAIPARAIGCCSRAVMRAQERIRPRREMVCVLPGIDPPPAAGEAELRELRNELKLPADALVVGIVGRLFAWKGQHHLLRAVADLQGAHPEIHCLIVGGGGHRPDHSYESHLHETVTSLGLENRVTFTGQVPDASPYVQLMDVAVNASAAEPFGLVVLEAMALGVPVVAVGSAGPAEIISDGVDGVLVSDNSPGALAAGIGSLLGDPPARERIAAQARSSFEARFTSERMAREMEASLARFAA